MHAQKAEEKTTTTGQCEGRGADKMAIRKSKKLKWVKILDDQYPAWRGQKEQERPRRMTDPFTKYFFLYNLPKLTCNPVKIH